MKLFDTTSLAYYLMRNLHSGHYDDHVAVLDGYTNAVEDRLRRKIPVMQTTLEEALDKVGAVGEFWDSLLEFCAEKETEDGHPVPDQFKKVAASIDYIYLFLDRLNDHVEATNLPNH